MTVSNLPVQHDIDTSEDRMMRRIRDAVSERLGPTAAIEVVDSVIARHLALFATAPVRDYVEILVVRGVLQELRC